MSLESLVSKIAYYRCSTADQNVESQRAALGSGFDREFIDEGVSGAILAADRPAFGKLLDFIRDGDFLAVYAVDRLGRDALDVQSTVRKLIDKGVTIEVHGLGILSRGAGELILAVLAQIADLQRNQIKDRCESGRQAARSSLEATGRTHRGKLSLGRPQAANPTSVVDWRRANKASIADTAREFGISVPTVKRYCARISSV